MPFPDMMINTEFFKLDLTMLGSAIVFCLTTSLTLLRIIAMKASRSGDDKPGDSPSCAQHHEDIKDVRTEITHLQAEQGGMKTSIATIELTQENMGNSVDGLKEDCKTMTDNIDESLKNIVDSL